MPNLIRLSADSEHGTSDVVNDGTVQVHDGCGNQAKHRDYRFSPANNPCKLTLERDSAEGRRFLHTVGSFRKVGYGANVEDDLLDKDVK